MESAYVDAKRPYLAQADVQQTEVEAILNMLGALIERSGMTSDSIGNIAAKLIGEPGNGQAGGTAPKPVRSGSLGKIRDMLDMIECNMGRTDEHVGRLRNAI